MNKTFTRYVNDPTTAEKELHSRSGQTVEVLHPIDPDSYDSAEVGTMYAIRFSDGYESEAFEDELK